MNRMKGRPIGSKVRQNIIEILYFYKKLYGYEIYKIYTALFPPVSMRLIYYHLKKGIETEEFRIHKIDKKSGNFSWGEDVKNIIYELGPKAEPIILPHVKLYWEKDKKEN